MSAEPQTDEKNIQKLTIDKSDDFKFHAAYLAYLEAWDKNSSSEIHTKLNEILTSLSNNEIDYETFYRTINPYRAGLSFEGHRSDIRIRIETDRKKDWRRKEQRSARNARHRK